MAAPAPKLTQREKLFELARKKARDAFLVFEHKEGSRLVDIKEIPTVVRSMGFNPNSEQITAIVDQIHIAAPEIGTFVPLETFETVMSKYMVEQRVALYRDDYHSLLRAFRALDPEGKGYIEVETLRQALSGSGEPMTEDEMKKMVEYCVDSSGRVNYEDYAWKLATDGKSI